jgi:hypothetical protein
MTAAVIAPQATLTGRYSEKQFYSPAGPIELNLPFIAVNHDDNIGVTYSTKYCIGSERMITFVNCHQVEVSPINTALEEASFNISHDADGVEGGHSASLFYYSSLSVSLSLFGNLNIMSHK